MSEDEENSVQKDSKLRLIIGVGLLVVIGGALIGPVLPSIVKAFKISESDVGLVLGVFGLSALFSLPLIGFLIDRVGRKKVLVPTLILNGIAGFACIFAPNFGFLLLARALQGIGVAGMAPVTITLIGDFYGGLGKVKAMGAFSGVLAIGGVGAPLIGGILADISWKLPFSIYLISVPFAFIIWKWLPEPKKSHSISPKEYFEPIKESLKRVETIGILFANFMSFFLLYTIVTYVPLLLSQNYGTSGTVVGIFLSVQGVAVALTALKADVVVKTIPRVGAICLGFLITGVALLFIPTGIPLLLIALPIGVFGVGRGLIQPQINSTITDVAPRGRLGGLTSAYNIMKYAGQMSAPFALGLLLTFGGYALVFQVAGILSLIGFGLVLKSCATEKR